MQGKGVSGGKKVGRTFCGEVCGGFAQMRWAGWAVGWGRTRKGPRPEIADSDGRETGLRGCGRREGAREEGQKPGRHRPGSLCTGSLRDSAQPPQRPGGPPPPPGPGALADPSAVPLSETRVGEGATPQPVPARWGGLLRGGAESTSKIPRHLFAQGGDTGRKKTGRPRPARSVRRSRSRTPAPPTCPPFPHPRSHQRRLAEQGGGGAKHGIGLGVEFGSCCPTDRSSKGENRPGGGLCKAETLKRRVWRAVCQNRSPQNTHRQSPT